MSRQKQVASKLEMSAVIRVFVGGWVKRCNCTEIYRQLHEMHGENAMTRQAFAKISKMFEDGHTHIDDDQREGRSSTATNSETFARVNEYNFANLRITIDKISKELGISHGCVHKSIANHLRIHKVCAQWVPSPLTEEHEWKHFESTFAFLQCYQKKGNEFLNTKMRLGFATFHLK
ncbi:HTH_48 domain-containing protein [Nephila pilipes]|uniref:HTH_48 domain-containing protein n=1 Tax=Nephila pilipes TaxID=299642 RepID=A0A8X6MXT4_NEPPI|nr:HTH_48 domain-containing protein [Nephila pilipes]